jgi:VanZ family protein
MKGFLYDIKREIFTYLLFFAFRKIKPSFLIAYLYSFSDEFHQYFVPGRTARLRDTFFDLAGIIIGFLIIKFLLKKSILK